MANSSLDFLRAIVCPMGARWNQVCSNRRYAADACYRAYRLYARIFSQRNYIGIRAWISLSIRPARAKFSNFPSTALLISWPFAISNKPSLFRTS